MEGIGDREYCGWAKGRGQVKGVRLRGKGNGEGKGMEGEKGVGKGGT
jgi:hypothetical protein